MKLYIVCFANATQDDRGNNKAYGDAYGAYKTLEEAKAGLEACKNDFVAETVQGLEDDDLEEALMDIEIYGSVDKGYFEICNSFYDVTYVRITETIV